MRGSVMSASGVVALLCACGGSDGAVARRDEGGAAADTVQRIEVARVQQMLDATLDGAFELADSIDGLFRPVPLLTPSQEVQFRRFDNAAQLARARALGVVAPDSAARASALRAGRLVRLEPATRYWIVRELTHSEPLVTPDAYALLASVGARFQQRLEELGVPPYRLEVTSALRTAEMQAQLRRTNPNAAAGESTHEYGTTVDVAFASFAAPATVPATWPADAPSWLGQRVEGVVAAVLESVAARNSRELQAILGQVMIELQQEGAAMVTMERLQPVFHFTVARRFAPDRAAVPAR